MRNKLMLTATAHGRRSVAARLGSVGRLDRVEGGRDAESEPLAQRLRVHRPAEVLRHRVLRAAVADRLQPHAVPGEERRRGQARLSGGRFGLPVVSKDGKTYTFTIRPGQKASNGKTVTPQWFVHAIRAAPEPEDGRRRLRAVRRHRRSSARSSSGAQEFYDGKADKIAGLSVKGNKLIIKLNEAVPVAHVGARDELVQRRRSVHCRTRSRTSPSWSRRGPVLHRRREIGRNVVLDRNQNYKGKRPRNADRIVDHGRRRREPEHPAGQGRPGRLRARSLPPPPPAALGDQFGVNKTQFFVKPTSTTSWWALNTLPGSPLANVKLRKAVNWAIDRPAQVRVAGKYGGRRTEPDPAAGNARLHPVEQPLRLLGRERRQGEGRRR